ncbi:MAG: SGNH hydrolase domain-containing protein [Janthinobacterium lividum]
MKKDSPTYEVIESVRQILSENNNYLDLHKIVCGNDKKCPVSTPEGYLISYDGRHLTQKGAIYIGNLLLKNKKFMEDWNSVFK